MTMLVFLFFFKIHCVVSYRIYDSLTWEKRIVVYLYKLDTFPFLAWISTCRGENIDSQQHMYRILRRLSPLAPYISRSFYFWQCSQRSILRVFLTLRPAVATFNAEWHCYVLYNRLRPGRHANRSPHSACPRIPVIIRLNCRPGQLPRHFSRRVHTSSVNRTP